MNAQYIVPTYTNQCNVYRRQQLNVEDNVINVHIMQQLQALFWNIISQWNYGLNSFRDQDLMSY